jgi:hypothetical protein
MTQCPAREACEIFEWIKLGLPRKSQTATGIEVTDWRTINPLDVVKTRSSCSRNLSFENFV